MNKIKSVFVWCFFKKHFNFRKSDLKILSLSLILTLIIFSGFWTNYAYSEDVNLQVTITASLTFSTTTDNFPDVAAGGALQFATTTLSVTTNNAAGWNVTLYGQNTGNGNSSSTMYLSPTTYATYVTDQTQWNSPAATTTAGTAVVKTGLANSQNVLAFRVMTASSTNSAGFFARTWWGNTDIDGTALWAGVASSTVQRKIGNTGSGNYSVPAHLNTVNYYLKVASTQQTGAYTAPLVYTATAN